MVQSIKSILTEYGIDGDIILYRDADHKKKGLCEYLAKSVPLSKEVVTYSDGAFGLYLARALPSHIVHTCYNGISPDYGELMEAQPNLVLHSGIRRASNYPEFLAAHPDYFRINQYTDDDVWLYYKKHFADVVSAVRDYKIDAFCDYSHSGATMRGFVEANNELHLVNWQFVMAVTDITSKLDLLPRFKNLTSPVKDSVKSNFCAWLDTFELGENIEAAFPSFGNVYEATRSIAGAMDWLKTHPGKTALVYVGDSPVKEGTKFRKGSRSIVGTKELNLLSTFLDGIKAGRIVDRAVFEEYYNLFACKVADSFNEFIFDEFLILLVRCKINDFGSCNALCFEKLSNILLSINPFISAGTVDLAMAILFKEDADIKSVLWNAERCSPLLAKFAIDYLGASYRQDFGEDFYNWLSDESLAIREEFRAAGALAL